MNYPNYYPNYPNYYSPKNAAGTPYAPRCEITRVNGKNGAEAFLMAPNSSALLMDENDPIVWLKTTDGAGYPTLTPYSISPYKPEPVIDVNSLEERVKRLEEMLSAKSDAANADGEQKAK